MQNRELKEWLRQLHRCVQPKLRGQGPPTRTTSDSELEETDPELEGWFIGLTGMPNSHAEILLFLDTSLGHGHNLWYGAWARTRAEIKEVAACATNILARTEPKSRKMTRSQRYKHPFTDDFRDGEHYYGWYEIESPDASKAPPPELIERVLHRLSALLEGMALGNEIPVQPRVPETIRRRRGQEKFRCRMLARFNNTCRVSGCRITALLEAAHINTQPGVDDHTSENGLLLRTDFHTLYDLDLLAIDPRTRTIAVHPSLMQSDYAGFHGTPLLTTGELQKALRKPDLDRRWARLQELQESSSPQLSKSRGT